MPFTYRSDAQILNPFNRYVIQETTLRSAFLTSGLVETNPVVTENITQGDKFTIPNWNANLSGTVQRPEEGKQATVNKLGSNKQIGVVHHCINAWGASELVKLAVGAQNDPELAIGSKIADWTSNAQQGYLLSTMKGIFGVPGTNNASYAGAALSVDAGGSGESDLSVSQIVRADLILGEDQTKYGVMVIHPDVFAYLSLRKMVNFVNAKELPGVSASTIAANLITASNAVFGDFSGAFDPGDQLVPVFGSKRVIVSDDAPRAGSPGSYKYGTYVFKPGAVGFGYQKPVRTKDDEDMLTSGGEYVTKVQWDACFHPLGFSYSESAPINPDASDLEAAANWSRVFELKNIGVANIVHTCPLY